MASTPLSDVDRPEGKCACVGPGSPEAIHHTMFRDWLRTHPDDRARYADAKRSAADVSTAAGEAVMDYNMRKQPVIREILDEMFRAHGML